jgi:hypothetical protein
VEAEGIDSGVLGAVEVLSAVKGVTLRINYNAVEREVWLAEEAVDVARIQIEVHPFFAGHLLPANIAAQLDTGPYLELPDVLV